MKVAAPLLLGLAGLAFACGGRPPDPRPVLLWERGVVRPRFPVVGEAAWEPVHQRLRRGLEADVAAQDLLVCYSAGSPAAVLEFYAPLYGVDPTAVEWRTVAVDRWQEQLAAVAAELGRAAGELPSATVRRADLGQRGDLPALLLESPHLDGTTGSLVDGTLLCMHWKPPADGPAPDGR